jgi:L-serine kinase (ADP)
MVRREPQRMRSTTKSARIELVLLSKLRHIEGFSKKRVAWLCAKISREGVWNKPLALDDRHFLVLDGQHRMEAARLLGLKRVPAVRYEYAAVDLWSLRKGYAFDWREVTRRALDGEPYPYKTVKHKFPAGIPACEIALETLMQ